MSEAPHDKPESVVDLRLARAEKRQVAEGRQLTPDQTVAQFLIRAQHFRDRRTAANYIMQMLDGTEPEITDDNEYVRRAALQELMKSSNDDAELDETNPIINELYTTLRQTLDQASELKDERKALRLLIDLAAVDNQEDEAAVDRWQRLVRKLGGVSLA